ncbi:hypothetical protein [Cohnella soli]|uniref:Butirosin biosynthesis protein H N-terminal domain-containing protein n=1 Tax=Cohnella soli TaxID=425005 RepID=A0ABW0I1F0_9BACL
MNQNDKAPLKSFFNGCDFTIKTGANCYWNALSVPLRYYGLDWLSLSFVNMGFIFSGPTLEYHEKEEDLELEWLFKYVKLIKNRVAISRLTDMNFNSPIALTVDLFPFSHDYPVFPGIHTFHCLNVLGFEEDKALIVDCHFGFAGPVGVDTLAAAVRSADVEGCGVMIRVEPAGIFHASAVGPTTDQLDQMLLRKWSDYIQGSYWPTRDYTCGLLALTKLKDYLMDTLEFYFSQPRNAYRQLCQKINEGFTDPREGFVRFLLRHGHLFSRRISSDLLRLMEHSIHLMRQFILTIIMGYMQKWTLSFLAPKLLHLLERAIKTETEIHRHIEDILIAG